MSTTNLEIEIEGDKYRLELHHCECSGCCYPSQLYITFGGYEKEEYFGEIPIAASDFIGILIEKLKEHRGEEMKREII
jgi:hypothetical protein